MAVGHFLMAVKSMFFQALIFLILGNGAFKPNISTQVGALFTPGDHRRDRAFSIFYMGINVGAFFHPLCAEPWVKKQAFTGALALQASVWSSGFSCICGAKSTSPLI